MSAHLIKGKFAFSCDDCAESFEAEAQGDFASAWSEAAALGWRAYDVGRGVYEHQCPDCAEDSSGPTFPGRA